MPGEVFGHYLLDRYAAVTRDGVVVLACRICDAAVCDIDENDTLGVLADMALAHWRDLHFGEGS